MFYAEHKCEIMVRREIIRILPDRGFCRKMYDFVRDLLMVSDKNPSARKYLRSNVSMMIEKRRHLRNFKHIIHPFSIFRHYWNFTIILTITCLLLIVPYQAVFEMNRYSHFWTIFKNFLLLLCCMDIIFNCITGYYDNEHHVVMMEPTRVWKKYLMHVRFLPDLLGSLPTDVAFVMVWQEYIVIREVTSLMCVFRAFSLNSYLKKMAHAYEVPFAIYEVCELIFWLVILLHWQCCLYWLVPIIMTSIYRPERPSDIFWPRKVVLNLWEKSSDQQYLSCFLRAVAVFLSSGFMDEKPRNEADLTLVIILQISGTLIIWILIARVKQFYMGTKSSKMRYQAIMMQIIQYMKHLQLPYLTQYRIISYYEFHFQRQYFSEIEILNTLSSQMRQEIRMHARRKLVENVTFFNNLPFSLLMRIVALLKSDVFLTNDVIVRANTTGDCMYFIASGTVAIYTKSGKEVCHLEDGAHFGEIALVMPNEQRVANVVAVEICELYRLTRNDFVKTIQPYPMLWQQIKNIAIERHERMLIFNNMN